MGWGARVHTTPSSSAPPMHAGTAAAHARRVATTTNVRRGSTTTGEAAASNIQQHCKACSNRAIKTGNSQHRSAQRTSCATMHPCTPQADARQLCCQACSSHTPEWVCCLHTTDGLRGVEKK